MPTRILLDRYVYEDIYPAFKATTDEKEITARLSRSFLNYLAKRSLVLTGDVPALVADIGCGPCDTLIKYLTGVEFAPGFNLRATDYLAEYADAERGEALRTLRAAQAAKTIRLAGFSVRHGDAFSGNLLELLSGPRDGNAMRNAFPLVFASHVVYHAEGSSGVQRLVEDVACSVLARDGICVLFHIGNQRGTFQDFRARFGSEAGAREQSNTGAVTIDDPPAQIAAACASGGLPMSPLKFDTHLNFESWRDADTWSAFKDPRTYDALADSNPTAYEDLKRLYFVVQRAPLEFAGDRSETGVAAFIDEIRKVITSNQGMLPSHEQMQVFTRSDVPARVREAIPEAIAECARVNGMSIDQ